MSAQPPAPIIIKRKKVIAGGHHGGAWKVAYADFVTAMMAFFLLMWLLGATSEKQRKGIADFFNPTIPVNKVSGGGSGAFGGDSIFTEETLSSIGTGSGSADHEGTATDQKGKSDPNEGNTSGDSESDELAEIAKKLGGKTGESMISALLRRHIVTRITDEGLIVEIFDIPDAPLFEGEVATDVLKDVVQSVSEVFRLASNKVAVQGHTASVPIVSKTNLVWESSAERASVVRQLLNTNGVFDSRMQRVTGFADRDPASEDRLSIRNNRIEIILLRKKP